MSNSAPNEMQKAINKQLALLKRGLICQAEVANALRQFAVDPEFFRNGIQLLPESVQLDLRKWATDEVVAHPEDLPRQFFGGYSPPARQTREMAASQDLVTYWARRNLYEYFWPSEELPEFSPVVHIGQAHRVICADDGTLVLGPLRGSGSFKYWRPHLARYHYIEFRADGKVLLRTSAAGEAFAPQENSPHWWLTDSWGFLVSTVESGDVPIPSEVWVDRSELVGVPIAECPVEEMYWRKP